MCARHLVRTTKTRHDTPSYDIVLPGFRLRQPALEHDVQLPKKYGCGDLPAVSLVERLEQRLRPPTEGHDGRGHGILKLGCMEVFTNVVDQSQSEYGTVYNCILIP